MLLNCSVGEDSRVPGTARRSNQSSYRKSVLNIHWKDWCWSWDSNILATWYKELTHLKRPWCWERLKAGGKGDDRGWDGWTASPTWWAWVWVNFRSLWWTGRPGVLQSMGSQRVRYDWAMELNWTEGDKSRIIYSSGLYFRRQVGFLQIFIFPWSLPPQFDTMNLFL